MEKTNKSKFYNLCNKLFKLEKRDANIKTEVIAGTATFLSMVYILPVNADMLSLTGMPYGGVFLATALAAIIATLIMAFVANFPVALAPGMGINAFFAFTLIFGFGFTFQEALAASLIAGVLFLIISMTGLRKVAINAIPKNLKYAVGASIGFFIAFIGLSNSGIVVGDPATLVALGDLSQPGALVTLFGIVLVLILYIKRVNHFIIISLLATMVVGLISSAIFGEFAGLPTVPEASDFSLADLKDINLIFGKAFQGFETLFQNKHWFVAIFTFLFVDFFDTAGTLIGVANSAGLVDEKTDEIEGGNKALLADSIGTVAGAILGTSTTTTFVESQVGIEAGARTGLSSVVVALLFGIAILLYPIFAMFTVNVTAVAMVFVGALMVDQLKLVDWSDDRAKISAFITIMFTILTFSVAEGIAFGILVYTILSFFSREEGEKINIPMIVLSGIFLLYYIIEFSGVFA